MTGKNFSTVGNLNKRIMQKMQNKLRPVECNNSSNARRLENNTNEYWKLNKRKTVFPTNVLLGNRITINVNNVCEFAILQTEFCESLDRESDVKFPSVLLLL